MSGLQRALVGVLVAAGLGGCGQQARSADLGAIYNNAAQNVGTARNPVIVIPGVLGSKLENPATEVPVWGSFTYGATDPDTAEGARMIALDHLRNSLENAEQFHRAIDIPASPPEGTSLHLIAGDTRPTADVYEVDHESGELRLVSSAPGDDTVTRPSALMDERVGRGYQPRLRSPIAFDSVQFLTSNHLGLTKDPLFANFVLYTLLERPQHPAGPATSEDTR